MTENNTGGAANDENIEPIGPNEVAEAHENSPEYQENTIRRKRKFIKKFVDFGLNKPSGEGVDFMNKIGKAGSMDSWLKKELKKYAQGIHEFESVDLSSIKYTELLSEVTKETVIFNNKRQELRKKILLNYDISPEKYSQIMDIEIEKLEKSDLQDYIDSDALQSNKLEEVFGKKIERKNVLEHLIKFNLEEKYPKLSDDNKDILAHFLNKLQKGYKFSVVDIQELFRNPGMSGEAIFNEQEKIEFVSTFIPTITLAEALKLKLLSSSEASNFKINAIIQGLEANGNLDSSEINIKRISKNFTNDDFIVPTSELIKSGRDAMRLISYDGESLRKAADEFDRLISNVEESGRKDLTWFKSELEASKKLDSQSLLKIKKGNVISLSQNIVKKGDYNKQESTKSVRFLEIIDLDDKKGVIKFRSKGVDSYDEALVGEIESLSYQDFSGLVKAGGGVDNAFGDNDKALAISKMEVLTPGEMVASDYLKDTDSFTNIDHEKIADDRDTYSKNLRKKLSLEKNSYGRRKYSDNQIDRIIHDDAGRKEFDQQIEDAQTFNKESLLKKIDSVDEKGGKHGFDVGTTFQLGDSKDVKNYGIYTITGMSDNEVSIKNFDGSEEQGNFQEFYKVFKEKRGQRTSKLNGDFSDLIGEIGSDEKIGKTWGGFQFKNNAIKKKEGNEQLKISYPFLAAMSGESEEMVKINSIDGGRVNFSYGNIKSTKKEVKGQEKKVRHDSYTVYNGSKEVSLAFFHAYIVEHKLVPRSLKEGKDVSKVDSKDPKGMHSSVMSKIFSNVSLSEVVMGMKQGIESFEEYLKEGNAEHSALVAQGVFGKFLPDDIKADLKSRVEQAQKKNEEAYHEKLKSVDSSIATEMIEKWLLDRNAPQYKKAAGVQFMLEKYGTLYAKKGLQKHKGSFLWYTALGGTVGDELYTSMKADQEKANENFNEEHLVYVLLVKQCKPQGYNGIKRRSRIHKDVKRLRATGKEEEIETGRTDSTDERTVEGRINGGMGELEGGTYPNAIGWAEKVIEKGGTMQQMAKIPFVMAFSGIAYNFDTLKISDALKNFPAKGMLIPLTRFMSYTSDLNMLNDTILELSKRIEARTGSKYKGMGEDAQKIHDNMKNSSMGEGEKIKKTEAFFEKYGTIITRSLFMLSEGNTDEEGYLSKLIFIEKDEHEEDGKLKEGNTQFKAYYDSFRELTNADADFTNKDMMTDPFKGQGVSGMHMYKAAKNMEMSQGGGFRNHDVGAFMWEEIREEFNAIIHGKYSQYGEKYRRKILKDMLAQVLAALIESHGSREDVLSALRKESSSIGKFFIANGIDILDMAKVIDYSDLEHGHIHGEAEVLMEGYLDNMLNGRAINSGKLGGLDMTKLSDYEIIDKTKLAAQRAVNDDGEEEDYRMAA